jgi:hypothetical protein
LDYLCIKMDQYLTETQKIRPPPSIDPCCGNTISRSKSFSLSFLFFSLLLLLLLVWSVHHPHLASAVILFPKLTELSHCSYRAARQPARLPAASPHEVMADRPNGAGNIPYVENSISRTIACTTMERKRKRKRERERERGQL